MSTWEANPLLMGGGGPRPFSPVHPGSPQSPIKTHPPPPNFISPNPVQPQFSPPPLHKTETDRSMSSELGDRRFVKGGIVGGVRGVGPEPENVQCPRCESTNTKFCCYNNYNLSQPRYFCKACRRYWTRRRRLPPSQLPPPAAAASSQLHTTPSAVSFGAPGDVNLNESLPPASFSSLLAPQSRLQQESPFLGLGGYGLGSGFDGLEFGPGDDGVVSTHPDQEPQSECNAWQVGETDGGDCFGWPELAMSTPGTVRSEHSFWPAN